MCGCVFVGVGVHVNIHVSSHLYTCTVQCSIVQEGGREDTGTQDILVTMMMGAVVGDIGG